MTTTPAAPVRALRSDARQNRERILSAARQTFARSGLSAGMVDVAAAAQVGIGTVYRHFPTKESLLASILSERLLALAADGEERLQSAIPADALFGFLDAIVAEAEPKRDLMDALAETGHPPGPEVAEAGARVRAVVDRMLVTAQTAGTVRMDLTGDDVLAIMAGIMAAIPGRSIATGRAVLRVVRSGLVPVGE